jgi:hypothetical protein
MNEGASLVSPCGLYCGACYKLKKGKCPGCADNNNASWCKIRVCTKTKDISTCADCIDFPNVHECEKFNNIFSKFFYYFLKSDRRASLQRIREIGIPAYAKKMEEMKAQVIKRK